MFLCLLDKLVNPFKTNIILLANTTKIMIPKPLPGPIPIAAKVPVNPNPQSNQQLQFARQGSTPVTSVSGMSTANPVKRVSPPTIKQAGNPINQNKNPNVGIANQKPGGDPASFASLSENLRNISNIIQNSHNPQSISQKQAITPEKKNNQAWNKKYIKNY